MAGGVFLLRSGAWHPADIAPVPPPADPAVPALQIGAFLAANRSDQQFPGGNPNAALNTARAGLLGQAANIVVVQLSGAGGVVGGRTTDTITTPYSGYDWSGQDARMAEAAAAGQPICLVLYAPPWCLSVASNGAGTAPPTTFGHTAGAVIGMLDCTAADIYVDSTTPGNSSGMGAADYYEYAVNRYTGGPGAVANYDIRWVIVGQEIRNYWALTTRLATALIADTAPAGSWDMGRYALLFNAVKTRFSRSVYPGVAAVKVGGPYLVTRGQLSSRIASRPGATMPAAAKDGTSVVCSRIVTVGGTPVTMHVDPVMLNAGIDFMAKATPDFFVVDGWYGQSTTQVAQSNPDTIPDTALTAGAANTITHYDGSVCYNDDDKLAKMGLWIEGHWPGIEKWCIETYCGSKQDPADFVSVAGQLTTGGFHTLCLWYSPIASITGSGPGTNTGGVGAQTWTAGNPPVLTPLGVTVAGYAALAG